MTHIKAYAVCKEPGPLCFLIPLDDSDAQQSLRTPAREVVYPVSEGNSETLVPR